MIIGIASAILGGISVPGPEIVSPLPNYKTKNIIKGGKQIGRRKPKHLNKKALSSKLRKKHRKAARHR